MTNELESSIFKTEGWILDRYDVPTGQNPLPYFDRVSYVAVALLVVVISFLE